MTYTKRNVRGLVGEEADVAEGHPAVAAALVAPNSGQTVKRRLAGLGDGRVEDVVGGPGQHLPDRLDLALLREVGKLVVRAHLRPQLQMKDGGEGVERAGLARDAPFRELHALDFEVGQLDAGLFFEFADGSRPWVRIPLINQPSRHADTDLETREEWGRKRVYCFEQLHEWLTQQTARRSAPERIPRTAKGHAMGAMGAMGALLVPFWCPFGALLVPFWCPFGALLVPFWCPFGALLVPFWCPGSLFF